MTMYNFLCWYGKFVVELCASMVKTSKSLRSGYLILVELFDYMIKAKLHGRQ